MSVSKEFATYACDLMGGVGPCVAKRMFGGWGISTDGLTMAILADLGGGEKLWLKANDETAAQFRAAGCEQFTYPMKNAKAEGGIELKSMNYFAAPEEAMDSPAFMLPWARLAMMAALQAQALKAAKLNKKPTTGTRRSKLAAKVATKAAAKAGAKVRRPGNTLKS